MLVAQILSLLYNIVDRIYIARIPDIGTTALGAVGLCFPIIVIITAFSNLFGSGGAPLFSIERGKGDHENACQIMHTSFSMLTLCSILLMLTGLIFAKPILTLFGADRENFGYACPYLMIYLLGTFPSMVATGMNPFINAQGYATTGMISVVIGAVANLILDPIFIFAFGMGIRGAAIATVISQILSAAFRTSFSALQGRIQGSSAAQRRNPCLFKICEKYHQPRNCRIYHAADEQPGNNLLQSRTFCHRRNALYFCHDNHLQRASGG